MELIPRAIARLVGWTAGVFYELDATGGPVPDGPVLVVANHPNSLLDPVVVFRAAGRPARPLAKAPLFQHPLIGPALRGLGGLPVFRRQDDPALMDRNEDTFREAVAALRRGDAVQIYPEGTSHSEPALVPLRTGAARIALRAEDDAGWTLGLRIVPIGLTYTRKAFFRGRVAAVVGEPFPVAPWKDDFAADPQGAVRRLTDEIARRLEAVTLNLAEAEDWDLIETADRLYAREKGWAHWRERERLGERLPRLRLFARGLGWLRAHDPDRHRRLAHAVRRYRRLRDLLGADEADVPPRYPPAGVLRYVAREGLALAAIAPLAAAGAIAWALPYLAPRLVLRLVRPEYEAVATYKLGTALLAFPAAYAAWIAAAALAAGPLAAVAAAALLPPAGLAALGWNERWARVRADARVFLRALPDPRARDRLAARRAALAAEFDDVLRSMDPAP